MSLLKTIRAQLGLSTTPANNFTWDASADNGSCKLARGNAGATTQDLITVSSSNLVTGGSGAILVGNTPFARVGASANPGTSVPTGLGAITKLNLDSTQYDTTGSMVDLANDRVVVPVAGYYLINVVVAATYDSIPTGVSSFNGAAINTANNAGYLVYATANSGSSAVYVSVQGSDILYLNAGAYVGLGCYHNAGVTMNNIGGSLSVLLIRAA